MNTPSGRYIGTPHRTIEKIIMDAKARVAAGEHPNVVCTDLVEGYGFGYGSANATAIKAATEQNTPPSLPQDAPQAGGQVDDMETEAAAYNEQLQVAKRAFPSESKALEGRGAQ